MFRYAETRKVCTFVLIVVFALAMLPLLQLSAGAPQARAADEWVGWYLQDAGSKKDMHSVSAYNANKAWIAGDNGIYRTTDGGTNWVYKDMGIQVFGISAVDANVVWAAALGDKIFRTTDGGANWAEINTGTGGDFHAIYAVNANTAWAVGQSGIIVKTTNGGVNWTDQSKAGFVDTINSITAANSNAAWAAAAGTILRTTVGGSSWTTNSIGGWFNGISAVNANTVWAVGSSVLRTVDGGDNWYEQAGDLQFDMLDAVYAVDESTAWAVGTGGTILKTTDGGSTWFPQESGTTARLSGVTAVDGSVAWAVGQGGVVLHTTDGGGYNIPPHISTINPASGRAGTVVSLTGTEFGDSRGYSSVKFDSVKAVEYTYWSDTQINVVVPEGVSGQVKVTVTTAGGVSNAKLFMVFVPTYYSYYFAEGCTRDTFDEWLCIQNPGGQEIEVNAQFMLFGGEPLNKTYAIPATSRVSVYVNDPVVGVGPGQDVSVKLWGEGEFYAERPMYFNYKGGIEGFSWDGGHVSKGAPAPGYDWYFAEGCTREGFEEWLCIQNPNDKDVMIGVDYITAGAYVQHKDYSASANSRISVFVNGDVGPGQDVSVHVHCDEPIVAERPMYFNYQGKWEGGHVVMGTDSPKTSWHFAEGTTRDNFDEWLCVQNPNNSDAKLTVDFLMSMQDPNTGEMGTGKRTEQYTVGANSRWTLDVNAALGPDVDCAMAITSTQPVVAERPMYFYFQRISGAVHMTIHSKGGHTVLGVSTLKKNWLFPEGSTRRDFAEYICIANFHEAGQNCYITIFDEKGGRARHQIHVGPLERKTIDLASLCGLDHDISVKIQTFPLPIAVERAMYFDYNRVWDGGHCETGYTE